MYRNFAYIYDEMMLDVDYLAWTDYIEKIFSQYNIEPKEIADLACGTGNVTISLAERDYSVIGVDRSEDMLIVAQEKARQKGLRIPFVCQDIRDTSLHNSVDAVLIMCDGINYVLNDEDLDRVFISVYKILRPGGLFIFDISSHYKLSSILANNTIVDTDEDISLIWENTYDNVEGICVMDLTFFVREDSLYQRFHEVHKQKAHKNELIIDRLEKNKYLNINCYDDITFDPVKKHSQRIFYVAQK